MLMLCAENIYFRASLNRNLKEIVTVFGDENGYNSVTQNAVLNLKYNDVVYVKVINNIKNAPYCDDNCEGVWAKWNTALFVFFFILSPIWYSDYYIKTLSTYFTTLNPLFIVTTVY